MFPTDGEGFPESPVSAGDAETRSLGDPERVVLGYEFPAIRINGEVPGPVGKFAFAADPGKFKVHQCIFFLRHGRN